MASHPHHHHCNHHHSNLHLATTCNTCYCSCFTPSPPSTTDPLLQALASQILLQQSSNHNSNHSHQYSHHKAPQFQLHDRRHDHHQQQQQQQHEGNDQTGKIISSLVARIDALESSLRRLSVSSKDRHQRYSSIRDTAARTIQFYFREFLVKRSRTLRNLKDLAVIKSGFNALKSSVSDEKYFDLEAVSREAMDLLFELDSIQGGDPMIRDGKRAISRDLVRFLEYIDGVSVKKRLELSTKAVKNGRSVPNRNKSRVLGINNRSLVGSDHREIIKKIRDKVQNVSEYARILENEEEEVELEGFHQGSDEEHIARVPKYGKKEISQIRNGVLFNLHGGQPRVQKYVSFAENGNKTRVFSNKSDTSTDESVDQDEQSNHMNKPSKIKEKIGSVSKEARDDEELHTESGESDQTSESEETPNKNSDFEAKYGIGSHRQGQNRKLIISAPAPVKMESRADMIQRES